MGWQATSEKRWEQFSGSHTVTVLTSVEEGIWTGLLHLTAEDLCADLLVSSHGFAPMKAKSSAKSISLYIDQAKSLYDSAKSATSRTSSLFYYYSFLNIAKSIIEVKNPGLRDRNSNHHHGLSRNGSSSLGKALGEAITVRRNEGIWHEFYEALIGSKWPEKKDVKVDVIELLKCCLECSYELGRIDEDPEYVYIEDIYSFRDDSTGQYWLQVLANSLAGGRPLLHGELPPIIKCEVPFGDHKNKSATNVARWTKRRSANTEEKYTRNVQKIVDQLPVHYAFLENGVHPYLPLCKGKVIHGAWPQLCELFSIFFWLGSLVRYDPEKFREIERSRYRGVIEALLTDSRIMFLALSHWQLYRYQSMFKLAF